MIELTWRIRVKRNFKNMDKLLLLLVVGFCILGLLMVYSSSSASAILRYQVSPDYFFKKQLWSVLIGFIVGFIIVKIPTSYYKIVGYVGIIASVVVLSLVLIYGKVAHNAQSWFEIGFFKVQPIEFVKTALIIFMAIYYSALSKKQTQNFGLYFVPFAISVVLAVLLYKQPDIGGAAIVLGICFLTFISVPTINQNMHKSYKFIGIGILIAAVLIIGSGNKILTNERMSRLNFLNPCSRYRDKDGSGYQVCNGLIAISNGGLFGKGLGKSTQKYLYLPDSHTDFIFPIICEELGAVVGSLVIIGYFVFLLRIYKIAKRADNLRNSLLAYGAFWYFALHIVINLLGVLALMPLTGIPLAFLSYGGSYTLNAIIIAFIIERVNIENKEDALTRSIKSY